MSVRNFLKETTETDDNFKRIVESMSGAEIAKTMNISRQAVSNTLKRAMAKMHKGFKKVDDTWNDFETAVAMSQGFSDLISDEVELKKFFKLFPPDLRKKIEADAKKYISKK